MKIVNLTPHVLHVSTPSGVVTIAPSGQIARVSVTRQDSSPVLTADGVEIPVSTAKYGRLEGLPRRKAGVVYIVSALVKGRTRRNDVYAPGELVRDSNGNVVGCKGLTV